jgi:hypothetical protein
MKKQRLDVAYEIDFIVYGIVSVFRDYKLAWSLNNNLQIELVKGKDVKLQFVDYSLIVTNFLFETENTQIRLIKNRSPENKSGGRFYFVPEMPELDYFLIVKGTDEFEGDVQESLRSIRGIEYVLKINIDNLKSQDNFIF